jgi:anti-sigma factor RsiW
MTSDPMCAALADAIEPIAAGELTPDAAAAEHISTCASCGAALALARRLDQLLRDQPAPVPPPTFTARTMRLIQKAGWRREQVVDWIFNSALIAAALLVATGILIALQRAGMPSVSHDALEAFSNGMTAVAQRAAPSLPLYAGATGLLVVALGLWWWASDAAL